MTTLLKIYNKILNFRIDKSVSEDDIRNRRLLNSASFWGSLIYLSYGITLFITHGIIHLIINISSLIFSFGIYFLALYFRCNSLASFGFFYMMPLFSLLPFYFIYGDQGGVNYIGVLSVLFIFVTDNMKKITIYIVYSILITIASRVIISNSVVDEVNELIANRVSVINIVFSLLLIIYMVFLFKRQVLKNNKKIILYSEELNEKYILEKRRMKQIDHLSKELNHRVKNNLQIVSSLIGLQIEHIKESEAAKILTDTNNRIISLAVLHKKLEKKEIGYTISLKEYINELLIYIWGSLSDDENATYFLELDKVEVDIEDAASIGLIVNELTTNAFKYGRDRLNSTLTYKLSIKTSESGILIRSSDSGSGFPIDFKIDNCTTFGLNFISGIVESKEGDIKVYNDQGANVLIDFKLKRK